MLCSAFWNVIERHVVHETGRSYPAADIIPRILQNQYCAFPSCFCLQQCLNEAHHLSRPVPLYLLLMYEAPQYPPILWLSHAQRHNLSPDPDIKQWSPLGSTDQTRRFETGVRRRTSEYNV